MEKEVNIVLSGEAGQGLKLIEDFIVQAFGEDYCVFSTKEVMSRVRGGNNTAEIRISHDKVYAFKNMIDILFLLNDDAFYRLKERISKDTLIVGEKSAVDRILKTDSDFKYEYLEISSLAKEAGGEIYSNTVVYGYICGLFGINPEKGTKKIKNKFKAKSEKIVTENIAAFDMGYKKGKAADEKLSVKKPAERKNKEELRIISGTEAVGIGAIAGGCNYVASYPMSPSTGVLVYLSGKSVDFDILTEQAEDEIAALNMVLGGWYAGARAMATTSGGGFSLMQEAFSLAGITESPCVIHVAQRPGPATGLPTRTEQGDLNLALYGGHGEFPRIIFAPGKPEDGMRLTQKAFWLADKYQVPVIILTDQFFVDSSSQMGKITLEEKYLEEFIFKTSNDYRRYKYTDNGISPRGIPGYGTGFVKVDSDEHDEEGCITEDFHTRIKMNNKRMNKIDSILEEYEYPEIIGSENYKNLFVCWGSVYGVMEEYIRKSKRDDSAVMYMKQLFPLPQSLREYFEKAEKIIVVENNFSGQLADLLKLKFDTDIYHKILKYNGMPFSIEEVFEKAEEVLK